MVGTHSYLYPSSAQKRLLCRDLNKYELFYFPTNSSVSSNFILEFDDSYRVFQKKVPTFVLLISQLPKHHEKWFSTFFNSPAFAESKNNNIFNLGL